MFDTIFGLPVHALVVHAVVVLVPLAAVGFAAVAVRPGWTRTYGWLSVGLGAVALASVPVAVQSGESLEASLDLTGTAAADVARHQDLAGWVFWAVLPMWLLGLALILLRRAGRTGALTVAVAALTVLAATAATVQTVRTGHAGSEAVWGSTPAAD